MVRSFTAAELEVYDPVHPDLPNVLEPLRSDVLPQLHAEPRGHVRLGVCESDSIVGVKYGVKGRRRATENGGERGGVLRRRDEREAMIRVVRGRGEEEKRKMRAPEKLGVGVVKSGGGGGGRG